MIIFKQNLFKLLAVFILTLIMNPAFSEGNNMEALTQKTIIQKSQMSNIDISLLYLQKYAEKDLPAVAELFADNIILRDWKILVKGKTEALRETKKNFEAVNSLSIEPIYIHESGNTVIAELKIVINGNEDLYVVDIITLNEVGKIQSIRAYLGRDND